MKKSLKLTGLTFAALPILLLLVISSFYFAAKLREVKTNLEAVPLGKLIKIDEGKIFVQEMGPPDGKPVVFIHGSLAWSGTWKGTMQAVSKEGYRAIAVDLPPFGFSDRPVTASYSARDQASRITQLIKVMDLKKPIIIGHSFGGSPTTEAVLAEPDLFGGLVLVDAAVDPSPDLAERRNSFVEFFLRTGFIRDPVIASTLTNPWLTKYLLQKFLYNPEDATDEIVPIYQQPLVIKNSTEAVGSWLPSLLFKEKGLLNQSPQSYKELNIPVLIIWGIKTQLPPSLAHELNDLIPNSYLITLKDIGHIPHIEDLTLFNLSLISGLQIIDDME